MTSDSVITISLDDVRTYASRLCRLDLMAELSRDESEQLDQMPQHEVLALLDLLTTRYGITLKRSSDCMTERDRHHLEVGHPLSYGCCRARETDELRRT